MASLTPAVGGYVIFPRSSKENKPPTPSSSSKVLESLQQTTSAIAAIDASLTECDISVETGSDSSAPTIFQSLIAGDDDDGDDDSLILSTVRNDEDDGFLSAPPAWNGPSRAPPAPLPEELEDWQHDFLTAALSTFNFCEDKSLEKRFGVWKYSDVMNQALEVISPYLVCDDPILEGPAWTLQAAFDHYEHAYNERYELLRWHIGGLVPSLTPSILGDYAAELKPQHDTLSKILEGTCGKIKNSAETRQHLIAERQKLQVAIAAMKNDFDQIIHLTHGITTTYLRSDNVFEQQRKSSGPEIVIPNFFDPENPITFPRDPKGAWVQKLADIQGFYQKYARILENHQFYIRRFIARTQDLVVALNTAIDRLPN